VELLRRTYSLKEQNTYYVSIYLIDAGNIIPEVKFGTPSGHPMLNRMQWVVVVTLKLIIQE